MLLDGCEDYALLDQYQLDVQVTGLPAPESFNVDGATGDPNSIMITWNYSVSDIDGFRIMRSENGGAFTEIKNENDLDMGSAARSYEDTGLNGGTEYIYRMYAVADGYLSKATAELSAYSNP